MHPITSFASLLMLISSAAAASHDVLVGSAGLTYSPNTITAANGDTVVFHFYPGEHNVVQGDFNKPCSTSGGFYSGFIDSESGESNRTFTITINDTSPIWIYCSQNDHCQSGMVMAINPPSSGNTLDEYAAACAKTSTSTTPNTVGGGVVGSASGPGSSTSASAASSASISSASAASGSTASSKASSTASSTAGSTASSKAGSTAGSTTSSTASATSAGQTSAGSTTSASASASPTKNSASVVGRKGVLGGLGPVVAAVAFWVGLM